MSWHKCIPVFLVLTSIGLGSTLGQRAQLKTIYKSYTERDGLLSNECHFIYEDDRHYLWISTDEGLNRFDGKDFTSYGIEDGLMDPFVIRIKKLDSGKVIGWTLNGGLFWLEKDRIIPIQTDRPINISTGGDIVITDIVEGKDGMLYVSSSVGIGLITVSTDGKTNRPELLEGDRNCLNIIEIDNKHFLSVTKVEGSVDSIEILYDDKRIVLPHSNASSFKSKPIQDGQNFYFATGNYILKYDGNSLHYKSISSRIWNISLVDNKLWLCTNQTGAIAYDKVTLNPLNEEILSGLYITSFIKDHNGQTWATAIKSGLLKFDKTNIQELIIQNLNTINFSAIESDGEGDLYMNWRTDEFYLGSLAKFDTRLKQMSIINTDIDLLFPLHYGKKENQLFYVQKTPKDNRADNTSIITSNSYETFFSPDTYANSTISGFNLIHIIGNTKYRFFEEKGDSIFIATKDKVNLLNQGLLSDYSPNDHSLISDIRALDMHGHTAFIGTKNKGLIIYDGRNTVQMTKNNGLLSNHISSINVANKDTLYIGTNKGVNRLISDDSLRYKVDGFVDFNHGLKEIDIIDLELFKDKLWTLTEHKLYSIDINHFDLKPKGGSYVNISYVQSGNLRYNELEKNVFDYSDKNISFQIDKLNFGWNYSDSIYIKLEGEDNSWKQANEGLIQYSRLAHGDYNLLVAPSKNEINGDRMVAFPFTITIPFYFQSWFIALSGMLLLLILYTWRSLKKKREEQEAFKKSEIKRLKMKALMAQINPHFTFNVLNSIQDLILKNEKFEAVDKLGDFSIMIRKILDVTRKSFVPISEDLELLTNYIQFEQLRFTQKFEYQINIEPILNTYLVPPLIIQPLVENAIWHGLKHNTDRIGVITINIHDKSNCILFEVLDNGQSAEHIYKSVSENKSTSKGLLLVQQRIAISNDKNFDAKFKMQASPEGMKVSFLLQKK